MALFDPNARMNNNVRPMNGAAQQGDRVPAQNWLNVGMTVPIKVDDGTIVDTFVTVLGIPLDNVQMPEFRGNSETYAQVIQAKRAMLSAIMGKVEGIEPGTELAVHGLEVQIRKVGDKSEPAPTEATASILDLIASRLSGKVA